MNIRGLNIKLQIVLILPFSGTQPDKIASKPSPVATTEGQMVSSSFMILLIARPSTMSKIGLRK